MSCIRVPALTDARRERPDARFSWVVEEAFAPLVALHPASSEVIPVAWRRWRRGIVAPRTWREIASFLRMLRNRGYDEIIDTQGLLESGAHRAARPGPPPRLRRRQHPGSAPRPGSTMCGIALRVACMPSRATVP